MHQRENQRARMQEGRGPKRDGAAGARLHGAAPPAVLHGDALRGRHAGVVVLRAQAALILRTRVLVIVSFALRP